MRTTVTSPCRGTTRATLCPAWPSRARVSAPATAALAPLLQTPRGILRSSFQTKLLAKL